MEKDTNPKDAIGTAKWRQFMTVPRQVMWEVGVAMLEGALKYGRHNYRASGVRASVYLDAAYGHLDQFTEGEDIDRDSGLSHVTKAIASLTVLRDAMMNDFWVDDRPPKIADLDDVRDRLQDIVAENFERYADKNPHHYTQIEDGAPYREKDPLGLAFDIETRPENDFRAFGFGEPSEAVKQGMMPHGDDVFQVNLGSDAQDADDAALVGQPEESSFNAIFESILGALPPGHVVEVQRAGDSEIVHSGPEVAFDDSMAFSGFAGGGYVLSIKPISEWDLAVGEHVVLEEDTTIYPKGTEFVVDDVPLEHHWSVVLRTLEGKHAGRWNEKLFSKVVLRVGEAGPEFVAPGEWNAVDDDLATKEILKVALSSDIQAFAAHLEDPTYMPYDRLNVLGDDDPTQILHVDYDHEDYDREHIVEGLTQKQFDNLYSHEAALMVARGNRSLCKVDERLFIDRANPAMGVDRVEQMLERRVLLGIKAQPLRQVRLDFPSGGSSERSTRLTNEQWFVAVPGVRVTEIALLFKPDSFA